MKFPIALRLFSIISAGLVCAAALRAQPGLVSERNVAPGVVHKQFTQAGPNTLDVLQVTLANPYIALESFRPNGLTRTTVQAGANDRTGHRVIGAVNADFFSTDGWPQGNQIVNGTVAHGAISSRSHLAVDSGKRLYIDRLAFRGTVWSSAGAAYSISQVNNDRSAGTLAFFTTYRGVSTNTDASGAECAVEFIDPPTAGDTLRAIVTATGTGNMNIPPAGGILSAGDGEPTTFLTANLHTGDTIRVFLGFFLPLRSIVQAVGGYGRFLAAGKNVTDSMSALEGLTPAFTGVRHPRTFVGFNADTTLFYLCTVDGRQPSSIGMTFGEMANFMISLGVSDAFNLDGGGSTTMVVRGEIVNSPSDPGGERSVANSLHVICIAPAGSLRSLSLTPKRVDLFQGSKQQFAAAAIDEYYNPIAVPADAAWEADPGIGTIGPSGLFTAATGNDSGWVRLRWHGVADSARVIIHLLNSVEPEGGLPEMFELGQNYPNPFNPTTSVRFTISGVVAPGVSEGPAASHVRLSVCDMLGREVAVLVHEDKQPGRYRVQLDASHLSSGTYFYRLTAGGNTDVKKMVVLK